MAKGGRRPGAGRKPKRLNPATQSPIKIAELKLAENLPKLVDVALQLALDGDKALLVYCIDRVLGRPTQPFDFHAAARRAAEERGLNPDRVIHLYEQLKRQKVG